MLKYHNEHKKFQLDCNTRTPSLTGLQNIIHHRSLFPSCSYFHSLVNKFEQQMALYQSQIEELEGHLSTMVIHDGVAPQS